MNSIKTKTNVIMLTTSPNLGLLKEIHSGKTIDTMTKKNTTLGNQRNNALVFRVFSVLHPYLGEVNLTNRFSISEAALLKLAGLKAWSNQEFSIPF